MKSANVSAGVKQQLGTWTPTLIGSTTPGVQTYTDQLGYYVKLGKMVFCFCYVAISAKDALIAGNIQVGGFPFAHHASAYSAAAMGDVSGVDLSAGYSQYGLLLQPGASVLDLRQMGDNVGALFIPVAALGAASSLAFSLQYRTA